MLPYTSKVMLTFVHHATLPPFSITGHYSIWEWRCGGGFPIQTNYKLMIQLLSPRTLSIFLHCIPHTVTSCNPISSPLISISDHHSQRRCWTRVGNNLWRKYQRIPDGDRKLTPLQTTFAFWVNIFVFYTRNERYYPGSNCKWIEEFWKFFNIWTIKKQNEENWKQ